MEPTGIGIVGVGMVSEMHARAIAELPDARLVGFCSRSDENVRRAAATHGCQGTTDLAELLSRSDLAVVIVATPSGTHLEVTEAAAQAGKHVLVEKPLEITLERCDAMIAACEKAGVLLGGVFQSRFFDAARVARDAVEGGRLGRPSLGSAFVRWWRDQSYYDDGGWKGTQALDGGGALMNQAIHAVDLLLWLMGPVAEVTASTATLAHERIDVEDTAVASLRFESGALGVLEASTATHPGFLKRVEVSGDRGSIVLEEEHLRTFAFAEERPGDAEVRARFSATSTGGGAADAAAISHEAHGRNIADFLAAIRDDRTPLVDAAAARRAVAVVRAVYEAAASRSCVIPG